MEPRINYGKVAPGVRKAMMGLEAYANNCGLERSLLVAGQASLRGHFT